MLVICTLNSNSPAHCRPCPRLPPRNPVSSTLSFPAAIYVTEPSIPLSWEFEAGCDSRRQRPVKRWCLVFTSTDTHLPTGTHCPPTWHLHPSETRWHRWGGHEGIRD